MRPNICRVINNVEDGTEAWDAADTCSEEDFFQGRSSEREKSGERGQAE